MRKRSCPDGFRRSVVEGGGTERRSNRGILSKPLKTINGDRPLC